MIVVNGRNRHTVFPSVANVLVNPKTAIVGKDFHAANAPVCICLHRPDEIAASWPGYAQPPGLVMRDVITAVGTLGLQGRLFRFLTAIDTTGRGSLDIGPDIVLHAARSSFGQKALNTAVCLPQALPDLRTDRGGSLFAIVGFMHALIAEDCNLHVGSATYVVNDLFEHKERASELGPLTALPRAHNPSPYERGCRSVQMLEDVNVKTFIEDCRLMIDDHVSIGLRSRWLRRTAHPVILSYEHLTRVPEQVMSTPDQQIHEAVEITQQCESEDWKVAAQSWVEGYKGWA